MAEILLGGLEAGGTKMVCCIGTITGEIIDKADFRTSTPDITMKEMKDYFSSYKIAGLGIGCFGPLELNKNSDDYGTILATPKRGWENYNIRQEFMRNFGISVEITTDVNAALLGEVQYGTSKGLKNVMYITVGTGIGAGIMLDGKLLQGVTHPEAGHIHVKKQISDNFKGNCQYHGCCLEGVASGPSIEKRWGKSAKEIDEYNIAWELEANYLAQAIYNYMLILSPQRIILGGGVMEQKQLFKLIRDEIIRINNGYIDLKAFGDMEQYIVSPSLNGEQGIKGCLYLGANGA